MIAIVDYGMGNLRSVQKALEKVGYEAKITSEVKDIDSCSGIVLPGVGSFPSAMKNLRSLGLEKVIKGQVAKGKPFLGICLGFQILFSFSEERAGSEGLDIFEGKVTKLPDHLKVPHMGWNQVSYRKKSVMFDRIPDNSFFYFVHSYCVCPKDRAIVCSITNYGVDFVSSIVKDSVFAVQFHPEKSQHLGLHLLSNFGRTVKCWQKG